MKSILIKSLVALTVDGNSSSASISSLQSCVSSVQASNLRGPEISPKLAKYFRADLIAHVTNWHADVLERQVGKIKAEQSVWNLCSLCIHFAGAEMLRGYTSIWGPHLHQDMRRTEMCT